MSTAMLPNSNGILDMLSLRLNLSSSAAITPTVPLPMVLATPRSHAYVISSEVAPAATVPMIVVVTTWAALVPVKRVSCAAVIMPLLATLPIWRRCWRWCRRHWRWRNWCWRNWCRWSWRWVDNWWRRWCWWSRWWRSLDQRLWRNSSVWNQVHLREVTALQALYLLQAITRRHWHHSETHQDRWYGLRRPCAAFLVATA